MDGVLDGLEQYSGAYIDDILIFSETWTNHLWHIKYVLDRLRQHGLTVRPKKYEWGANKLEYLGFVVGKELVEVPEARMKAMRDYKGAVAHGVSRSINFSQYFFLLLHCVPLYVCRLCINFQELCARLLGMATLRIRFSPSFHALLIDFLSIRKVIIFSAIATDDRHPLRSRSIHQNAANCMTIRFRYIAQSRGDGKPTAHAHVMMFDALPVGRTACRVRR